MRRFSGGSISVRIGAGAGAGAWARARARVRARLGPRKGTCGTVSMREPPEAGLAPRPARTLVRVRVRLGLRLELRLG